jgi:hypothetical protein
VVALRPKMALCSSYKSFVNAYNLLTFTLLLVIQSVFFKLLYDSQVQTKFTHSESLRYYLLKLLSICTYQLLTTQY